MEKQLKFPTFEETSPLSTRIDAKLLKEFREACKKERVTIKEILECSIKNFLDSLTHTKD